jgi:hypothetical protein
MPAGDYKPLLDEFMRDAEALMWNLSQERGYFTNYEFIRRAAQKRQGAYARLIAQYLQDRGEQYLFNLAHQAIGGSLSSMAQKLGYQQEKGTDVMDWNIWGDQEKAVVYRRTDAVRPPQ